MGIFNIFPSEFRNGYGNHDDCIRMPIVKHHNKRAYFELINNLATIINQRVEMVASERMRELLHE